MPRFWIKLSLSATSLAPVLLTYAALVFLRHPVWALILVAAALGMAALCDVLIKIYKYRLQEMPLRLTLVEPADQTILTFVLTYLLPLVSEGLGNIELPAMVVIFLLLLVIIYHSNAYTFNPLLAIIFRYHFYKVVNNDNITYGLVSKRQIKQTEVPIEQGRKIDEYMFLDLEE